MTKKLRTKRLKSCWVYVLECGDGSYYTGWTNDLAKRVRSHQSGKGGKYTRSRLPVRLIKKWKAKNRSEAMGKEAFFKSLSRKEKEIKLRQFGLGIADWGSRWNADRSPCTRGLGDRYAVEKKVKKDRIQIRFSKSNPI